MKKCLFFFLYAICLSATPFYQNPSPEAAYHWLASQKIHQSTEEDRPFILSLTTAFIAQIVKLHPDYIETFAQDFAHLSSEEKVVFSQAFAAAGIQDSRI
jgi:hypothetical protein